MKLKIILITILIFCLSACDKSIETNQDDNPLSEQAVKQNILISNAKNGDHNAQMWLGLLNIQGEYGFEQNTDRGMMWLKRAADTNPEAMNLLGDIYHKGDMGIQPNLENALYWYNKAADNNERSAMTSLGFFHNNGFGGLDKNCNTAIKWYTKVDTMGFVDAQGVNDKFAELSFLNNYAWALATCEDKAARNGNLALKKVQRIYELTTDIDERILDTAAAANAEIGNYAEAIKLQNQALELLDPAQSIKRYQSFKQRLEFYKQGQNWRGASPAEIDFYDKALNK